MQKQQIHTPQSSTGLMRFYDVSASKIHVGPEAVVGFALVVVALELLLGVIG
ncbi:hypothetical protein COX85_03485 [Candidatus Micrarchaeota archaeon CG_4_10_14_0_2_um_filter_55_9]|nr:MAG: hypothetical protein COX85_03485 [Candidatus Micrarchaeota archaeon CG_4_10_14_0_2_um_filter_55_9]QBM01478.1 hypothetical protein [uncultured archaeon]